MAQRLVHQVMQVLAPECVPLFLTDGFREYLITLVTHYGQWIQPERRQAKGPVVSRCPQAFDLLSSTVPKPIWASHFSILDVHQMSCKPLKFSTLQPVF
jgi:hypothetical protein